MIFSTPKRVFVIEDHEMYRLGLKQFLTESPGFEWAGESAAFDLDRREVTEKRLDLVLLDLNLGGQNAIPALKAFRAELGPQPLVCVLSNYNDPDLVESSKRAGAQGYLLKEEGRERLTEVLDQIQPEGFVGPDLVWAQPSFSPSDLFDRIALLSPREIECIPLLASALTAEAGAAKLNISVFTLKNHRKNIYRKLGIQTKTELFAICKQQGWPVAA